MNTENWYPSEEEYTPNLSKDDWLELLQDEKIFDYNSMCMMRRMKDIGGEATCKQLADKYGKTPSAYVAYEKALAKRILDNSNCNAPENVSRFSILFFGKFDNDNIHYIWKLRPELSAVLDEIDLTKYELYEGKNKMVLQEIYEKQCEYYTDCFPKYEKQVKRFINAIKNNTCDDEVKKDLIYTKDNHIANVGRGTIPNTNDNPNYNNLLARWGELYSILKNIVDENDCTNEQFNQIRQIFKECCGREKTVAPNRIIATFLPNVLTTTANETDFYFVLDKMKSIFDDYPSITKNWLTDNKKFIEYVNQNVKFKHPWHSSIFAWCLKEYFEMIDEQNKNKQKEQQKEMDKIEHYKKLLQANHNLILTGAPGTGKTHLAKEIASLLCFGCVKDENEMTDEDKKQIGFVQFHPSYDYTDFVEGLRPDPDNDESKDVSFIRMDGVFKEFCKRALKANFSDGVDNFDEVWEKLVEYLNENDFIDVQSIKFGKVFNISLNATGTGLMCPARSGFYFSKEQLYKVYRGEKGIPSGAFDNVRKAIIKKMHSDFDLEDYKVGTETNENKNYVFIIDEINRGEISKIFGELFFSIDPGYRGEKGRVLTQYQNLVTEYDEHGNEDPFTKDKGGFYVPENVYIIGTMNDIDRSVESMDFAFRRRFAFDEVTAEHSQSMLGEDEAWKPYKKPDEATIKKIKNRMNNLNNAIEQIEGLSSAYHIGASYFLKLQNYDGDFEQLWKYHIKGLLYEYLRGNPNADDLIGDLKSAYDNENPVTETQDDGSGDVAPANN